MIFDLKLTKVDLFTIILLSVLFFGIAATNLGELNAPVTDWQTTTSTSFYVDLGSAQQVQNVYFWVKSGNGTATVYSGAPGSWNYVGNYSLQDRATDYSVQPKLVLNTNTQYLRFDLQAVTYDSRPDFSSWGITNPGDQDPSPFLEVTEIGVESPSNTQIPITSLTALSGGSTTSLQPLADEQDSLEIPPTYMSKMYFDEVYFARAAENYVHHDIPKERTHPPLGKLIQATGVLAFGETPFGWRIMGVIFATLMVPLMYLIGKKLFGTWIGGFSASFLFTFDFMHFTMARIGTVDTYVVFFSLMTQLLFLIYLGRVLKEGWRTSVIPLFLAVVFAALGFSSKWFSLFGVLGMLALLLAVRLREVKSIKGSLSDKYLAVFSHPFLLLLGFAGVFAVIYFATYIPEMILGDSPLTIFRLQDAMLSFHAGSVVDSSSAPWWTWPLMINPSGTTVPKWFDITYLPNNSVSTISSFGNPAVWWIGFGAMILLAIKAFHIDEYVKKLISKPPTETAETAPKVGRRWDPAALFIVVVFLFSWLAYVFVGRATYIYHYYLSVPLICLAITYFLNKIWSKPWGKIVAATIFVATVALFVVFYPVISGAPVSSDYVHILKWFPSWYFAP